MDILKKIKDLQKRIDFIDKIIIKKKLNKNRNF